MTEQDKRKNSMKTPNTETLTLRIEPKLRYLAELAGRKQRRTLTSFIKWATERGLNEVLLKEESYFVNPNGGEEQYQPEITIARAAADLWDVDEADRFIKLALRFPDLLTHEEQVLWKLIRENRYLWRGSFTGPDKKWTWTICQSAFYFERLREHWPTFVDVARGEKARAELPTWSSPELENNDGKNV